MSRKASIADDLRRAIAQAERKGQTRYAIAKAAGLAESQVLRIAKGETIPTLDTAERLAKGIGIGWPRCNAVQFSKVDATRPRSGGAIVRYRVCRNPSCKFRWTTTEA